MMSNSPFTTLNLNIMQSEPRLVINRLTLVAITVLLSLQIIFVSGEREGDEIGKLLSVPFSTNIEVTSKILETNLKIQQVSQTSITEFYSTSLSSAKVYINKINDDGGVNSYSGRVFMHQYNTIELTRVSPTKSRCEISNQYTVNYNVYGYDPNINYYLCDSQQLPKYVVGPSHLLGILLCHREKFQLVKGSQDKVKVRNLPALLYEAKLEPKANEAAYNIPLIVRVYLDSTSLDKINNDAPPSGLPMSELPLSIELVSPLKWNGNESSSKFVYDETTTPSQLFPVARRKVQINFYRFEKIAEYDLFDGKSNSIFSMPLGSGCSDMLDSNSLARRWKVDRISDFSFEAIFMTGPNKQTPIRYKLAYDGVSKIMRRDVTDIRRGKDIVSSTIYDKRGWLKYHQYRSSMGDTIVNVNDNSGDQFKKCVTSSMSDDEFELVDDASSMLDVKDAIFMGKAMIRGVVCNVYEKKLSRYPSWIVSREDQEADKFMVNDTQIYAVYYEANLSDDQAGKLMRITILSTIYDKPFSRDAEVYSFSWSLHSFDGQASINNLFDISHCLERDRHVRVGMSFEPKPGMTLQDYDQLVNGQLKNELTRDNALLKTICRQLNIPRPQIMDASSRLYHGSMVLEMILLDLPGEDLSSKLEDRAFDMTKKTNGEWELGHHAHTQEECKWWALHQTNSKSFMYCPMSAHCLVETQEEPWPREGDRTTTITSRVMRFSQFGICTVFTVTRNTRKSRFTYVNNHYDAEMFTASDRQEKLYSRNYELIFQVGPTQSENRPHPTNAPIRGDISIKEVKLSFKLEKLKVSRASRRQRGDDETGETNLSLQGLGHILSDDLPNKRAETLAPGMSHDLVSCHQACTVDVECQSFSMCRQRGKLDCILSGQNFTNSLILAGLVYKKTLASNGDTIEIDTSSTLSDDTELEGDSLQEDTRKFRLRVDKYCNIHTKQHLESFQFVETRKLLIPIGDHTPRVNSLEDCAKFCLDKARNFRLEGGNVRDSLTKELRNAEGNSGGARRWIATCIAFDYSEEYKLCTTYPIKTHTIQGDMEKNNTATDSRKSLGPMKDVSRDYYTLKMINLFHGTFGYRLENSDDRYVIYMGITAEECAKKCFLSVTMDTCKSFDMIVTKDEAYGHRVHKCQLNRVSVNDHDANHGKNTLVHNDDQHESWHYEPNWMASLFMSVDHEKHQHHHQQQDNENNGDNDDDVDSDSEMDTSTHSIYLSLIILFLIAVGGLSIGFTVTRFYFEFTNYDSSQLSNRPHERLKG